MEFSAFFIVVFLIVLVIFSEGVIRERRLEKKFIEYLKEAYGKQNESEIDKAAMDNIASYNNSLYEKYEQDNDSSVADKDMFMIDNITWNDLGMDDVFMKMNTCQSSIGEEELYHRLHRPNICENDENKDFISLMKYFDENENDRINVLRILHRLGINRKTSITKIYDYIGVLNQESNLKHYINDVLMLASIISIFIMPAFGVLFFMGMMLVSIGTYLKEKRNVDPFISTINYTSRMIESGKALKKLDLPILKKYIDELEDNSRALSKLSKNSIWISSGAVSMDNPLMLVIEYVKMIFHVDIIMFNIMVSLLKSCGTEISNIRRVLGTIDASIAAASYRRSLKQSCEPAFVEDNKAVFEITNCIHPLIKEPVENSITSNGAVLLTGSNASGKSTFLKSVSIAALLAQTVGFAPAQSYRASRFKIFTSMALTDSIKNGESYFIVEIKSIKRILDASKENTPVLCLIDEVLRGTNTVERIAASTRILKNLVRDNVCSFAATHDIELTKLLEKEYTNYHFEEEVTLNDVKFNYILKSGPAVSRNAIKLLQVLGYDQEIVSSSEQMVDEFMNTGIWRS